MKKALHVISNGRLSLEDFAAIAKRIDPYVDKFHIREKQRTAREIYRGVQVLIEKGISCHKVVIHDRIDVAWAASTGVQLAYHSLPVGIVKEKFPYLTAGVSVHSFREAIESAQSGADYLLFGHVFETESKRGFPARGVEMLKKITMHLSIPVIAIGGIKPENVWSVLDAGAAGIAVMSGILQAENPVTAARKYAEKLEARSERRDGFSDQWRSSECP
jgi:thiazole tautomerase (transcriptional regulator TenI)